MSLRTLALAISVFAAGPLGAQVATDRPTAEIPILADGEGREVAEKLARALETSFIDLKVGGNYATRLRAQASAGSYDEGNWRDLTDRINSDLDAIQPDGHLRLFATVESQQQDPVVEGPPDAAPPGAEPQVDPPQWIAPGVAYIRYHGFPGWRETKTATDAFLREFAGAEAVIFDMRDNSGGGLSEMDRIFALIFPQPTPLVTMQVNRSVEERDGAMVLSDRQTLRLTEGPDNLVLREHWALPEGDDSPWQQAQVYVLTGRNTLSAAEHFALALKRTHRATLVGQPTGGANHFGGEVRLSSHFAAFVPVGRTFDPDTGLDWEGVGIVPDVDVPEEDALEQALSLATKGGGPIRR